MAIVKATRISSWLASPFLLLACVSAPSPVADAVRSEYQQAAGEPEVGKYASIQLSDAQQSLQRLEAASRQDQVEVEHLAYVTRQRIAIARAAGELGALEAETAHLGKERDELRLHARTQEADVARAESAENLADAKAARSAEATAIDRARELEARISELKAEQTERGLVMTMRGVLFASGSDALQPGAERALSEVAGLLNEFPGRGIAVEGHTDSVGGTAYNQDLSRRRAESVASFLGARGVASTRIVSRGLGESMPVASNTDDAGRQANRRVEIVLSEPTLPVTSAHSH